MENFVLIITKPDNVPIIGMLFIVGFFVVWGLLQARRNDKLIEEGKRDEIVDDMER